MAVHRGQQDKRTGVSRTVDRESVEECTGVSRMRTGSWQDRGSAGQRTEDGISRMKNRGSVCQRMEGRGSAGWWMGSTG